MTGDDPHRILKRFAGVRPPAPAWFDAAMADRPAVASVAVEGADIEYLCWGRPGAPGLLLVHGGRAHARWWAHVAPMLAQDRRVAALSLSGMGGSGWRPHYAIEQYAREMRAVAAGAGLDRAGPPVVVGHSFGCAPTVAAIADPARWAASAILIDGSISMMPGTPPPASDRHHPPFDSMEAALARYRLIPPQPCENPWIVDGIARASLVQGPDGWRWSFDPALGQRMTTIDTRAAARAALGPIAYLRGSHSAVVDDAAYAGLRADLPQARFIEIPDCGHHVMIDRPLAMVAAIRALLA